MTEKFIASEKFRNTHLLASMKGIMTSLFLIIATTISSVCVLWKLIDYYPFQNSAVFEKEETHSDASMLTPVLPGFVKLMPQSVEPIHEGLYTIQHLSSKVLKGIKKFVFFVGSGRSGHSIVGSLMDAHPHVIISHEYHIFKNWLQLYHANNQNWTQILLRSLYLKSNSDASGIRNSSFKGYTLKVDNLWQGKFDQYIEVVGDKSAGSTTKEYIKNKMLFKKNFKILKRDFSIPILIIHVIRNPFDLIATQSLYANAYKENSGSISAGLVVSNLKKELITKQSKFKNDYIVKNEAFGQFTRYKAVVEMIEFIGRKNVLDVHISDLINDPKATLAQIFEFVEIYASEDFLEVCASKVFKSMSRTRELILWPPEIRQIVEKQMKDYEFLTRYNFTSD